MAKGRRPTVGAGCRRRDDPSILKRKEHPYTTRPAPKANPRLRPSTVGLGGLAVSLGRRVCCRGHVSQIRGGLADKARQESDKAPLSVKRSFNR